METFNKAFQTAADFIRPGVDLHDAVRRTIEAVSKLPHIADVYESPDESDKSIWVTFESGRRQYIYIRQLMLPRKTSPQVQPRKIIVALVLAVAVVAIAALFGKFLFKVATLKYPVFMRQATDISKFLALLLSFSTASYVVLWALRNYEPLMSFADDLDRNRPITYYIFGGISWLAGIHAARTFYNKRIRPGASLLLGTISVVCLGYQIWAYRSSGYYKSTFLAGVVAACSYLLWDHLKARGPQDLP